MDAASWKRVKAAFQEVLAHDEAERPEVLERACGGDAALREATARMLRAHARAAEFLETPAALPPDTAGLNEGVDTPPPEQIGPYRVLSRLGHGGMGEIYLAERDEPGLRKTVAIKVVRSDRNAGFVLRRFQTESQILAGLEHPGIARLYDGGTTGSGLPYFVMEHVDGEDLLGWCDARRLPVERRLRLFRRVCDAVQYAHAHLVVHRDLKPSNILVTPEGEPKLLDFGIAKLLGPSLDGPAPDETTALLRLMTPDYASPEQARGARVTTASDVYSLGFVLCELLAGARPYEVTGRSAGEIERAILEVDAAPPSAVATPQAAAARGEKTLAALRRRLRGDLDNVVLKALRKEPAERYTTAAELEADLRRHLEGFPVRARPVDRVQRALKFVKRHRAGVVAVSIAAFGLVAGLAVAVQQRRVAEAERRRAEARFEDVRRLANSVIYELHDAIANLPGATPAQHLLVTRALEYLDRLAAEAGGDVGLQRELADAYRKLANAQNPGAGANLGNIRGALDAYEKALGIRRELAARTPPDPEDVAALGELEFDLGVLHLATGELAKSEATLVAAAQRFQALAERGALPDAVRLGSVYQRLAYNQSRQGKYEAALASAERALLETDKALAARPDDEAQRLVKAWSQQQLAEALDGLGRPEEALSQVRPARRAAEAALDANPLDAGHARLLQYTLNAESGYLRQLGDLPGARRLLERALRVTESSLAQAPEDRWSQTAVAINARQLGRFLHETGDTAAAVPFFRRALALGEGIAEDDPLNEYARLEAASAREGLGKALLSLPDPLGRHEGCAALERVRATWIEVRDAGQLPPGETAALEGLTSWLLRCQSVE